MRLVSSFNKPCSSSLSLPRGGFVRAIPYRNQLTSGHRDGELARVILGVRLGDEDEKTHWQKPQHLERWAHEVGLFNYEIIHGLHTNLVLHDVYYGK
jgi:hypothetical protein